MNTLVFSAYAVREVGTENSQEGIAAVGCVEGIAACIVRVVNDLVNSSMLEFAVRH